MASISAAVLIVGCGDDDANPGQPDSGQPQPDAAKPDSSQPIDSGTDTGVDGGRDSSIADVQPKVVPLSTGGHDSLYGVTFDTAGNIYAVGRHTDAITTTDVESIVVKFKPDGSLDTGFGTGGVAKVNLVAGAGAEFARAIVVQSTGKIVIGALAENATDPKDRDIYLARFKADGKLDDASDFGASGIVTLNLGTKETLPDAAVVGIDNHWGLSLTQGDGLIVTGATKRIGATDTDFAVVKLDAKGAKDTTFATASPDNVFRLDPNTGDYHPNASPRNATVLADGSIVVAGYQTEQNGVVVPVVFKLSAAGVLDSNFGSGGVFKESVLTAISEVYGAAPQGANFVTAGYGNNAGESTRDWLSIRVLANGTRDMTYGTGGFTRIDVAGETDNARAVTVLPDERVVMVGGTRAKAGSKTHATIGLLTKNGTPDTSFGPKGLRTFDLGGAGDFFWATAVSPDKKTLATVGLLGAVSDGGDDDAALLILPLP